MRSEHLLPTVRDPVHDKLQDSYQRTLQMRVLEVRGHQSMYCNTLKSLPATKDTTRNARLCGR